MKFIKTFLEKLHIIHSGEWVFDADACVYYRKCNLCGIVQTKEHL